MWACREESANFKPSAPKPHYAADSWHLTRLRPSPICLGETSRMRPWRDMHRERGSLRRTTLQAGKQVY